MKSNQKGNVNVSGNTGVVLNTGTAGNIINQVSSSRSLQVSELEDFIRDLEESVPHLDLNISTLQVVQSEVATIKSEISASKPKSEAVKLALSTLHGILLGVAGNGTYAGIVALLQNVKGLIAG